MEQTLQLLTKLTELFEKNRDEILDQKAEIRGLQKGIDNKAEYAEYVVKILVAEKTALEAQQESEKKAKENEELKQRIAELEKSEAELQNRLARKEAGLIGLRPEEKAKMMQDRKKKAKQEKN